MTDIERIRNFCILAHIDHGKSTLADRMLEITGTVERRKMREQLLDTMELERERGITIKMTPVTMKYRGTGSEYILNLIDTPGHIDFSYEVSRSLKAVEGAVLLVDATQGVQAQTITTLEMARAMKLAIIPVVSKVDSPLARVPEVKKEVAELLRVDLDAVLEVSGKTGFGVAGLLDAVIARVPAPRVSDAENSPTCALVFDFKYSEHQGIIVYARVFDGSISANQNLLFAVTKEKMISMEVGIFTPEQKSAPVLRAGEIGYIITGIKEPSRAFVGDTVTEARRPASPLPGYKNPQPVVWASLYPESQDDFVSLRRALDRLKLSDASLQFEEERSASLGRGFRAGFLGMLHLEIIMERLRREFDLQLIITPPTIIYEVEYNDGKKEKIYSPPLFPDHGTFKKVREPLIKTKVITPVEFTSPIMQVFYKYGATVGSTQSMGGSRVILEARMPLRELMRGFFDELKRVSSGYASLSYELLDFEDTKVVRLDILVADELVPAFSHIIAESAAYTEARRLVDRLYEVLPKALFPIKIQGSARGRILASRTLPALRKDVTGYLYGGDITRKRKLWEKQKRGKKKLATRGKVNIPHDVFLKILKQGD